MPRGLTDCCRLPRLVQDPWRCRALGRRRRRFGGYTQFEPSLGLGWVHVGLRLPRSLSSRQLIPISAGVQRNVIDRRETRGGWQ
jgi:hypothetical protein